jgi:UDP-2,3-diacylglucosamine pyrophosphatase LpxH
MPENQSLLEQLEQMLHWKKSKKYYADKLGITEAEIDNLLSDIRQKEIAEDNAEIGNYIADLEDRVVKFTEDLVKGTGEVVANFSEEVKSLDELIDKCKIDTEKWEITKYVQNFWGNGNNPHWQVKAWLGKKSTEQVFQDSFVDFLASYQPVSQEVMGPKFVDGKTNAMLVINKQDSHLNKYDIDGNNSILDRLSTIMYKVEVIANQAQLSNNLEQITYIIGSDEFNSEYTNATTKGTPQTNTHTYHDSFQFICDHEVLMITMLLQYAERVNVVYVAGNHDEFVGWHMVNWLQTYFRNTERLTFDCSPKYRKYISYGESALMFNHGDAIKPAKLAALFPIEFREAWSFHNNFYIFTGDKHHEVSQDFNGIKFYQIPAFSNAKSLWDDKMGHTMSKAEVTGFLVDQYSGMTNIFKQYL